MTAGGLIIAAPSSASGKTLVSLGLMAAFRGRKLSVRSAKVGPDYIDPAFHAAATGRPGVTLDGWAMSEGVLAARVGRVSTDCDLVICEGVMGLFDGADVASGDNDGSTAQIAAATGWPVILVVDAARMAGSAAAVVAGFAGLSRTCLIAGAIFNRVGSDRHRAMIERAMAQYCPHVEVLGFLPHVPALAVPSRHLGLVQAAEHPDLASFIAAAAAMMTRHLDIDRLRCLAEASKLLPGSAVALPPLGQRIAVARDEAFAFVYDDLLVDWRRQGAEIAPFSPLADQPPPEQCDAVYLPGGYPELSAAVLAGNALFKSGVQRAARRGAFVYGECGGYMTLGQAIVDKSGTSHAMIGLLPVVTSMENAQRHLGYRRVKLADRTPLGRAGAGFRGHEFHYAEEIFNQGVELFLSFTAKGEKLCSAGCAVGAVSGSFVHLISAESMISS